MCDKMTISAHILKIAENDRFLRLQMRAREMFIMRIDIKEVRKSNLAFLIKKKCKLLSVSTSPTVSVSSSPTIYRQNVNRPSDVLNKEMIVFSVFRNLTTCAGPVHMLPGQLIAPG